MPRSAPASRRQALGQSQRQTYPRRNKAQQSVWQGT